LSEKDGIKTEVEESSAQCGGGTLPNLKLDSFSLKIVSGKKSQKACSEFAERIHQNLLNLETPVLGILRKGELCFDVLTVQEEDFDNLVGCVHTVMEE